MLAHVPTWVGGVRTRFELDGAKLLGTGVGHEWTLPPRRHRFQRLGAENRAQTAPERRLRSSAR